MKQTSQGFLGETHPLKSRGAGPWMSGHKNGLVGHGDSYAGFLTIGSVFQDPKDEWFLNKIRRRARSNMSQSEQATTAEYGPPAID